MDEEDGVEEADEADEDGEEEGGMIIRRNYEVEEG